MMEPISAIQMAWRKYKYKLQMYTGQRLEGLFLFIRELYIQEQKLSTTLNPIVKLTANAEMKSSNPYRTAITGEKHSFFK